MKKLCNFQVSFGRSIFWVPSAATRCSALTVQCDVSCIVYRKQVLSISFPLDMRLFFCKQLMHSRPLNVYINFSRMQINQSVQPRPTIVRMLCNRSEVRGVLENVTVTCGICWKRVANFADWLISNICGGFQIVNWDKCPFNSYENLKKL